MRAPVLLASVISGLALAACGTQTAAHGPGAGPAVPTCPDPSTIEAGFLAAGEESQDPLPDDVVPTGVLSCRVDVRDIAGEGRWSVLIASWADSGLEAFVSALREPDEPSSTGACPDNFILSPWFALVVADGSIVHARVPETSCFQPQRAALEAFAALPFTVVKETRIRQVETAEAQASGCPQQWKDMVVITAGVDGAPGRAEQPVTSGGTPTTARICYYESDGAPPDQTPTGTFVKAASLTGDQVAAALAGLQDAPAAKGCTTEGTTFAVVMLGADNGPMLTVETAGCLRILTDAGELRQAPESLLAALR